MQKDTVRDLRQDLILAGMEELNEFGPNDFSLRRVASACGVSTAAPYKHFKDRNDLIRAIIDYVNGRWAVEQDRLIASCSDDPREQMVTVVVGYVKFLMENPHYRRALTLKTAEFNNLYHRRTGEINSRTEEIMKRVKERYGLSDERWAYKTLLVRSVIFGSVFLFDCGEFTYDETALENVRYLIDREFTVH